jgi:hypothetical protein
MGDLKPIFRATQVIVAENGCAAVPYQSFFA